MINLSRETEALARRLATAEGLTVEDTVRLALEERARLTGMARELRSRRRMTVEEMLAVGTEIAAMPLLDRRSPRQIMDGLDAL